MLLAWRRRLKIAMKCFRHRQMRARFALLAMIGLLWSQLVLAEHPLCPREAMAMPEMAVAMVDAEVVGAENGCHPAEMPATEDALCAAHCSQGDQTNDVARVPMIPALPPAPVTFAVFVLLPADPAPHSGLPPPVSWHRPTAHPAALLLI